MKRDDMLARIVEQTGNICMFGDVGTGHTYLTKKLLMKILTNTNDAVYVIGDVSSEYRDIVSFFNGVQTDIADIFGTCLNPLAQSSRQSSKITVFNVHDANTDVVNFGIIYVLKHVWEQVQENFQNGIRSWVILDPANAVMLSDTTSAYINFLQNEFRTHNCASCLIVRNANLVLQCKYINEYIANAYYNIILPIYDASTIRMLEDLLNEKDIQTKLDNKKIGEGIIIYNRAYNKT